MVTQHPTLVMMNSKEYANEWLSRFKFTDSDWSSLAEGDETVPLYRSRMSTRKEFKNDVRVSDLDQPRELHLHCCGDCLVPDLDRRPVAGEYV